MSRPRRRPTPRWVEAEQRYIVQLSNGRDPVTGARRRMTLHDKDFDRCMKKLIQMEASLAAGEPIQQTRQTFAGFAEHYLDISTNLRPNTAKGYRSHLEHYLLPAFGHRRLRDLEPGDIKALWARMEVTPGASGRPLKAGTLQSVGRTLSAILSEAVDQEVITRNPYRAPKMRDDVPWTVDPPRPQNVEALFKLGECVYVSTNEKGDWLERVGDGDVRRDAHTGSHVEQAALPPHRRLSSGDPEQ